MTTWNSSTIRRSQKYNQRHHVEEMSDKGSGNDTDSDEDLLIPQQTKQNEKRRMTTQSWYGTRKIWYRISETFWNRMASQVRRCWGICEYLWILNHLSFKVVHVWYRTQNGNNDYDHSTIDVWLKLNHLGNNKSEIKLCCIK